MTEGQQFLIPSANDLSLKYLGTMFGAVGNNFTGFVNPLMAQVFTIYNYGILSIAMIVLGYTLTFVVVNDMTSGQPLAQHMDVSSVSRVVIGNGMLLPVYNGYSFIQVILMQVVISGVGLADNLWSNVIGLINTNSVMSTTSTTDLTTYVTNDVLGQDVNLAPSTASTNDATNIANVLTLFGYAICGETQYRNDAISDSTVSRSDYQWRCNGYTCQVGKNGDCATIQLVNTDTLTPTQLSAASNSLGAAIASINSYVINLYDAGFAAGNDFATILNCPLNGVQGACDQGSTLGLNALSYFEGLQSNAYTTQQSGNCSSSTDDAMQDSINNGWVTAGTYLLQLMSLQGDDSCTEKQVFDENLLLAMMYRLTGVNTNYSPANSTGTRFYSMYQYMASTAGINPSVSSNSYNWTAMVSAANDFSPSPSSSVTYTVYGEAAAQYVSEYYAQESSSSSSFNCSGSSNENPYLDTALSVLYNNWLKYQANQGPYDSFDLDAESFLTAKLDFANTAEPIYISIYQRNLFMLLNRTMEDLTGLMYFPDDSSQAYSANYYNSNISQLSSNCSNSSQPQGCYCALVNSKGVVNSGQGLFGSLVAQSQGYNIDALRMIQAMGTNMLNHGVLSITQTYSDALDLQSSIGAGYATAAAITATPYMLMVTTLFIFAGNVFSTSLASMASVGLEMLNKTWRFMQDLDYLNAFLFQPISSTFSALIPVFGLLLGVYVPAIPAIYHLFGVIAWMIAVIELMIAAPVIAMAMSTTTGHQIAGNAEPALVLILQIFLRPALIIFGLMSGLLLSNVVLSLLNQSMVAFIASFSASFQTVTGQVSAASMLIATGLAVVFYGYVVTTLVANCYSLIFRLNDRILQYVGGQIEYSGLEEMIKGVRSDTMGKFSAAASSGTQFDPGDAKGTGYQIDPGRNYQGDQDEAAGGGGGEGSGGGGSGGGGAGGAPSSK